MPEYSIPIMMDVTADSEEEAVQYIVRRLGFALRQVQNVTAPDDTESWESRWTIDRAHKHVDGNDNDHGVVVFSRQIDYGAMVEYLFKDEEEDNIPPVPAGVDPQAQL